jgi:RNA polymerase sigma-70 factor (ECF subfamily)
MPERDNNLLVNPDINSMRLRRNFFGVEDLGTLAGEVPSDGDGQSSDASLWSDFRDGEEGAFIQLYQRYANVLFNYGCQFSPDAEMVKDCLQDFFIYLRKTRSGLSEAPSVRMYLFKAFRRRVLDYVRKHRKECQHHEAHSSLQFHVELSSEAKYIDRQFEDEQLRSLNDALRTLDPKEREAVYYFYYEGLSYEEIAEIFHFSHVSSARRLIYRTLSQLRKFVLTGCLAIAAIAS